MLRHSYEGDIFMLGERLKYQRKTRGINQAEMALRLGMTRQGYSHYETGRNEPDHNTLSKIADILNCSIDYLLGREDSPTQVEIAAEALATYDESIFNTLSQDPESLTFIKQYLRANQQQQRQIRDFASFILSQEQK